MRIGIPALTLLSVLCLVDGEPTSIDQIRKAKNGSSLQRKHITE